MFSIIMLIKRGKSCTFQYTFLQNKSKSTHQFFEGRHVVALLSLLLRSMLHHWRKRRLTILALDSFEQFLEVLRRMLRSMVGRRMTILTLDSLEKLLEILRRMLRS